VDLEKIGKLWLSHRVFRGLPEELWLVIQQRLPEAPKKPKGGRPSADPRKILASIFYVLRSGLQWKALPSCREFVSGSRAHEYFQLWTRLGIFDSAWEDALEQYDEKVGLDWKWQSMDGSTTKAPLGGKLGVKRSIFKEAQSIPIAISANGLTCTTIS
jgi:putative transposase